MPHSVGTLSSNKKPIGNTINQMINKKQNANLWLFFSVPEACGTL